MTLRQELEALEFKLRKLRLEDAEAWAAVTGNAVKVEMLLALKEEGDGD